MLTTVVTIELFDGRDAGGVKVVNLVTQRRLSMIIKLRVSQNLL